MPCAIYADTYMQTASHFKIADGTASYRNCKLVVIEIHQYYTRTRLKKHGSVRMKVGSVYIFHDRHPISYVSSLSIYTSHLHSLRMILFTSHFTPLLNALTRICLIKLDSSPNLPSPLLTSIPEPTPQPLPIPIPIPLFQSINISPDSMTFRSQSLNL